MLTKKGNEVIAELYSAYRADFFYRNSYGYSVTDGYSESDCERAFLYTILLKVSSHNEVRFSKISDQIETIR